MTSFKEHLILSQSSIKQALLRLDKLGQDAILFVINGDGVLLGALTDGDVRRGLIGGADIEQSVNSIFQTAPRFIKKGERDIRKVIKYRDELLKIIPVVDQEHKVVNVINFREMRSYLPVDTVIMAGGKGQRLLPLTLDRPKPLLTVGTKPIIEHNLERLCLYGIDDFWISVNYLGEQIEGYLGAGVNRNIKIKYVWESDPMGTIGSVSTIEDFLHDYILVTNSDILTNLDYEHFFLEFLKNDADLAVVTIPYQVNIPYAVLETAEGKVLNFKEKPSYTYYSNGGIYLFKRDVLQYIPRGTHFNATDLMERLLELGRPIFSYPLMGYWLDIGTPEDFRKAQEDINYIKF